MLAFGTLLYKLLIRPLLFLLPAEVAHSMSNLALRQKSVWQVLVPTTNSKNVRLNIKMCGIQLANPVGLSAGYDKNCEFVKPLSTLGFGYVMCGTVTEFAKPGNPKPRLFRLPKHRSLINAMGFPNNGLKPAIKHLNKFRQTPTGTPVGVSISGTTSEEIAHCHCLLEPLVDLVEINISSPNTSGLRVFHEPDQLSEMIARINETRQKPLVIKLPPYPSITVKESILEESREQLQNLIRVCLSYGVDAVTAGNSRPASDSRLSTGTGGLSGKMIRPSPASLYNFLAILGLEEMQMPKYPSALHRQLGSLGMEGHTSIHPQL